MMEISINEHDEMTKLRDISSAFSRSAFTDILYFDDYSKLDWIYSKYKHFDCSTYSDFLRYIYINICKKYRCEYVYKNELIKLLQKKYGTRNTVFFSEFRVGNSIADIAMFNGESKAFEIKTEYDTPKRLTKQMDDYKRLFDKCYLVIPENRVDVYMQNVESSTGIIVMIKRKGRIYLEEIKNAEQNLSFDAEILISCLRTSEYCNIASALEIDISNVPGYNLFTYCKLAFQSISPTDLKNLFLKEIKARNNITPKLRKYPLALRQMMLSLNLPEKKAEVLINKLNVTIKSV